MINSTDCSDDFGNRLRLDSLNLDNLDLYTIKSKIGNNSSTIAADKNDGCIIRTYPRANYQCTYDAMLGKTLHKIEQKQNNTALADEIWLVEHTNVYTLGQAGKREHILQDNGTPIIKTDRGGQVTWHGTGQLVVYFLWDLNALGFGVRDLVSHAEQAIEDVLNAHLPNNLYAKARKDAPGVYIYNHDGDMLGKIASLGFKIKHAHSYHGIAININNDLSVFNSINPCGYAGMTMLRLCDLSDIGIDIFIDELLYNLYQRRQGIIALRSTS